MEEYSRPLKKPEARHRYLHIPKAERDFFPGAHVEFNLSFNGKTYVMKVNHKDDIMTGQLYHLYRFHEGDQITIKKTKKGHYELFAPDAETYPDP